MARALTEDQLARDVFTSLQAVSCPLVEGVRLQDCGSIVQLLCAPSQHRTDILTWICCRIKPNFCSSNTKSTLGPSDQEALWKEMALLGQELLLCRAAEADQHLIREASTSVLQQLGLLQQLLALVPGSPESSGSRTDAEMLLNELCAAENRSQLAHMLTPTLDPWPSHLRRVQRATGASCRGGAGAAAGVCGLLQQACCALEQLQAECDFLGVEAEPGRGGFCPSSLQVAAGDLRQLMATFSRVYEADLRAFCCRDPPRFSADADIFQRTRQLLKSFITEVEVLQDVPEACLSVEQEVKMLQTQPRYRTGGARRTFYERLEELIRRVGDFSSLLGP